MSDSFAYSGDSAAEARRYELNGDMRMITCRHQINDIRPNPAVFRTSLQIADDCRQSSCNDGLMKKSNKISSGRESSVSVLTWSNAAKKVQAMKAANTTGMLLWGKTWVSPAFQVAPGFAFFPSVEAGAAGASWGFSS